MLMSGLTDRRLYFLMNEMASRFPEWMYPARDVKRYLRSLVRGYRNCKKYRVLILGLARDLGEICPYTIHRINRLGGLFADYKVAILENDSADNTAHRLLRESNRNPKWRVFTEERQIEKFGSTREESRARRMAEYRNRLKDLAAQNTQADYVIVVDTDLEGGYSYDGVAHTFSLPDWDVVGSNGIVYENKRRLYYDSWAFRRLGCVQPHLDEDINPLVFNRGEEPFRVKSCFGGLAAYCSEAYYSGRYGHLNEAGGIDCDHVTLHEELIRKGFDRIYLNPSQITLYSKSPYIL